MGATAPATPQQATDITTNLPAPGPGCRPTTSINSLDTTYSQLVDVDSVDELHRLVALLDVGRTAHSEEHE